MKFINRTSYIFACLLSLICITACATKGTAPLVTDPVDTTNTPSGNGHIVKSGEEVRVDYTCKLKTGKVVFATEKKTAEDPAIPKSHIFTPFDIPEEVEYAKTLVAGSGQGHLYCEGGGLIPMANEIMAKLSENIVGMEVGKGKQVEISSKTPDNVPEGERYLSIALKETGPIETREDKKQIEEEYGKKNLQVGDVIVRDGGFIYKVTAIEGDQVVIRAYREGPDSWESQFGKETFYDKGDHWEIVKHPKIGDLVKVDVVVGRVIDIGEQKFKIDFANPFGEEKLICDINVEDYKPAKSAATAAISPSEVISRGDQVKVNYTMRKKDSGEVLKSSMTAGKDEAAAPKVFIAGYKDETVPGVGEALVGMKAGDKKTVTLASKDIYGEIMAERTEKWPCVKQFPKRINMTVDEYVKQFKNQPLQGEVVSFDAYLSARVKQIDGNNVSMVLGPEREEIKRSPIGNTKITPTDDDIILTLTPKIGAVVNLPDKKGKITATDGKTFTVAFSEPIPSASGKEFILDIDVVSFTPASQMAGHQISWIENYQEGLKLAEKEDKPVVLVLYASWCSWCHKLLSETLTDPRISSLDDRFVWIKTDSSKEKNIGALYEQKSFPTIVLMNAKGEVINKISGFKNAGSLLPDLNNVLSNQASKVAANKISWIENYQEGMNLAKEEDKPVVLVLYADWCKWCHRLLSETLTDPRISNLDDRFVWIKTDSSKEKNIGTLYEQKSFPTIVLMNPKGEVIEKITGFKDAGGLLTDLKHIMI